ILTATTSEVFRFGRPSLMTGFQASYAFTPWLDVSAWVVSRWENEITGEEDFNDNNKDKTFGGRIGFTPFPREGFLSVGVGGFWGPEQEDNNSNKRWVVDLDFTWTPLRRLLFAGEFIYGGEANRELRKRGLPFPAPEEVKDVNWRGFYLLTHYDILDWLGLSFRWGLFDDMDGGRTGVKQVLQSWTFAPIFHLSRLIPELRPTGAAYARTRHPIDWVDLKVEYRLNHSNRPVFSDARSGVDILEADRTSHQVELQLVVNFWNFL
ncbi:MAG: outer membrane beta-barrel protein, partial [Candidatus Methylomirabilales bacterium]